MPIGKLASPVNLRNIHNAYIKEDLYKASDIGKQVTSADNSAKSTRSFYPSLKDLIKEQQKEFDDFYSLTDRIKHYSDVSLNKLNRRLSNKNQTVQRGDNEKNLSSDLLYRNSVGQNARTTILDEQKKIIEQRRQIRLVKKMISNSALRG